jgi:Mor family transcriptional regulator
MQNAMLHHVAKLHPKEILEPFDTIMEQYGFDAVCTIVDCLGGSTVYIPSKRYIFQRCLEKEVEKEFAGSNYAYLTRKYGFSERHLRRMLNGK